MTENERWVARNSTTNSIEDDQMFDFCTGFELTGG